MATFVPRTPHVLVRKIYPTPRIMRIHMPPAVANLAIYHIPGYLAIRNTSLLINTQKS